MSAMRTDWASTFEQDWADYKSGAATSYAGWAVLNYRTHMKRIARALLERLDANIANIESPDKEPLGLRQALSHHIFPKRRLRSSESIKRLKDALWTFDLPCDYQKNLQANNTNVDSESATDKVRDQNLDSDNSSS